jgi:hypothetical protein
MQKTPNIDLFNLLVTRDFAPKMKNDGADTDNPAEANMFYFDWKTPQKNYGTVVVMIGPDKQLIVFYNDNLGRNMETGDKQEWYEFLNQLKEFSVRNNMKGFESDQLSKLKYTMQGMAAIKEGLFEGYYGNKRISYSDHPQQVKLVIHHDRALGDNDKRYRNIDTMFVETATGERFRVPTRSLAHGKMLACHVANGGNPYDAFGQHIGEVIAEMNILRKFVRAARNRSFDGAAGDLCETAIMHYNHLKDKAKRMISQRGYRHELESYDPAEISETNHLADSVRNMFTEQSLDSRIEEAIPILARLANAHSSRMQEADEFESWAHRVTEGTWATPDSPATEARLKELLGSAFPVGPDATYATEQLYDIFGDDELFDQLSELADQDPNADAGPLIRARLETLGIDIDLPSTDVEQPTDPAAADSPPPATPEEPVQAENLDVDGVMMTKPSNMSSESIDRILKLAKLLR